MSGPYAEGVTYLSLSTMWAQQERFEDLGYFRDYIAAFGYDAIEVSHLTNPDGLKALLTQGVVPLSSLHAPTPNRILENGRRNAELNLASPDADQTRFALEETKRTIDYAAEAGLRYVVVHLGGVGDDRCDEERTVRRLYESGQTEGVEWDEARRVLAVTRAEGAAEHLEVAKASLAQLVEYASRSGIAIGIESRLNYHEIPHPAEAAELLAPYTNVEAGFWWDIGHTEVQSRLGMIELTSWFDAIGDRIIGSHLHDVRGILDHRGPGNGTLDWGMVAEHLPPGALRVMEIDQHEPEDAWSRGRGRFWRSTGSRSALRAHRHRHSRRLGTGGAGPHPAADGDSRWRWAFRPSPMGRGKCLAALRFGGDFVQHTVGRPRGQGVSGTLGCGRPSTGSGCRGQARPRLLGDDYLCPRSVGLAEDGLCGMRGGRLEGRCWCRRADRGGCCGRWRRCLP